MAVAALRLREDRTVGTALPSAVRGGLRRYGVALSAYGLTRVGVLAVAVVAAASQHLSVGTELSRWDGQWYLALAQHGYPSDIPSGPSTLGFLPGYSLAIRALAALSVPMLTAALVVALASGLISTLLVQELATSWWGDATGRRAAVLFTAFPGTVVFSMAYSDGLFLALVTGCLLALEKRRWVAAGACAALATATGADGAVLALACLVAAVIHIIRNQAWKDRRHLVCLAAPALAPVGLGAFCLYLWVRVGSPIAFEQVQRRYWGNHISPIAIVDHYLMFIQLGGRELNLLVGLLGIPFIIGTRYLMLRRWARPPGAVLTWGFGVTGLSVVSAGLAPNPRMLLLSFPSSVVLARYSEGRRFWAIALVSALALVFVSWWTLSGQILP